MNFDFDADDKYESLALEISQELASKRGRRKQYIVDILVALYEYRRRTGRLPSSHAVANAIEQMQ